MSYEAIFRLIWGELLGLSLEYPDDPKIQAAFRRADAECRKAGFMLTADD